MCVSLCHWIYYRTMNIHRGSDSSSQFTTSLWYDSYNRGYRSVFKGICRRCTIYNSTPFLQAILWLATKLTLQYQLLKFKQNLCIHVCFLFSVDCLFTVCKTNVIFWIVLNICIANTYIASDSGCTTLSQYYSFKWVWETIWTFNMLPLVSGKFKDML